MRFRENSKRLIALLLALITVLSLPLSAGAISYDGSGTSSGGNASSSGNGTFGIARSDVKYDLIGYRFTGINAQGERANNAKSLDVIFNYSQYVSNYGKSTTKLNTMSPKYSKLDIHLAYDKFIAAGGNSSNATTRANAFSVFGEVAATSTTVWGTRTIWETTLTNEGAAKLSKSSTDRVDTSAELDNWQGDEDNLNPIAERIGYPGGVDGMNGGDKIIAEPLYYVILEGSTHALTPTEIALYTALTFSEENSNIMTDKGTYGGGNENNPTFIRKFTNYYFPNSFFTPNGQGLWDAATNLGTPSNPDKFSTYPAVSYGNILKKGYGAVIMYTSNGPALPDYYINSIKFVDNNGTQYDSWALPLNKTINVIVEYNCYTTKTVTSWEYDYANLFFYNHTAASSNFSYSLTSDTAWQVIKSTSWITGGNLDAWADMKAYTTGSYKSTAQSARYVEKFNKSDQSKLIVVTSISSRYSTVGRMVAQIQKKNCSYASSSNESNTRNNTMEVMYRFTDDLLRDVETTKVVLKDDNGNEYSDYKAIPFGARVNVYHEYRSRSIAGGNYVSEPAVTAYAASKSGDYYRVKIDGKYNFELGATKKQYYVGSFEAGSLINQYRYGAVYLANDYNRDMSDEDDKTNNTASAVWRAKCNIQLYQIILHDGNGKTYETKTYNGTYNAPTLPVGTKVYITYVYKNTSGKELCVYGYKTDNSTKCTKYWDTDEEKWVTANNSTFYVPDNGTLRIDGGSFTVATGGGTVKGSVYVDKDKYLIPSSWSISSYETDASDNTLEARYYAKDPIDLEITKIQYVYTDKDGEKQTLTVNRGGTNIPEIPLGATVAVWYTYKNNSDEAVKIDGYYSYNKTGSPGTLISDTRTDYNANGITINAGKTKRVCSGSFTASKLGEAYYYGAVFQDGKTSATGEKNTTNNEMTAKYKVRGYDVAITDIYFVGEDGTEYSKGANRDTMEYGETYDIYYTIQNNSTEPVHVNLYDSIDPNEEGALCVTPVSYYRDGGIYLEAGDSTSICVGELTPANQVIGENCVDGSVFIGSNTSTNFTYGDYTGSEAISVNNMREETVVLKFDVAITDIYHTLSGETARLDDFVPAKRPVDIHYVVKNNSNAPVKVNVYYESEYDPDNLIKVSDHGAYVVIELGAGEEADIIVNTAWYDTDKDGYTFWGHVYRDNQTPRRDPYEKTFENNVLEESVHVIEVPYLEAIKPNAKYRVGTDVITSFYLHNPTDVNYTGLNGNGLKVAFTVKDVRGNVLYTATQDAVVVPANCEGEEFPTIYQPGENGGAQLVFFKWSMPEEYEYSYVVVNAELYVPDLDLVTTSLSNRRYVCSNEELNTPDTQYEAEPPTNWQTLVNASAPFNSASVGKSWYVYTYTFGRFARNSYFCALTAGDTWITPMSVTTRYDGSQYYMRSGYGVRLYSVGYSINKYATQEMYTDMQYAYATWQEFGYSTEEGCITTLEKVGSLWQLPEFLHYDKRVHFTPIWYPNRDYSAYVCYSDLWTPMGMITVATETNEIIVDQDMYDDWYISH